VTLALLALVLHPSAAVSAYGSSRWLEFGPVTVQPSEIAKLALVVFGAAVLSRKWGSSTWWGTWPAAPARDHRRRRPRDAPAGPGTTLIISGTMFLLMFAAGVRLRYLLATGLVGGAVGMALIFSADYWRVRFLAFLDPWADASNSGYQLIQSLIALGSGGWLGWDWARAARSGCTSRTPTPTSSSRSWARSWVCSARSSCSSRSAD
jgi:cell division protein FtsW